MHSFPYLQQPSPPGKVEVVPYAPGYNKAKTDADLAQLYKDNLEPDLAPFRRKDGWSIEDFKQFVLVSDCVSERGFVDLNQMCKQTNVHATCTYSSSSNAGLTAVMRTQWQH